MIKTGEFYQKNLEYIKKTDLKLFNSLENVYDFEKKFQVVATSKDEPNLKYCENEIHSFEGANDEAHRIVSKIENCKKTTVHVVFGLGVGYLLNEIYLSLEGNIVVYEPSLEILKVTLGFVDFENLFKSNRLRFAYDEESLKNSISQFFKPTSEVKISFLNFYSRNFNDELNNVLNICQSWFSILKHNVDFFKDNAFEFFNQASRKIDVKLEIPSIEVLQNRFTSKPALIVSAGPSLEKNIEFVKKYRNKFILFAVGTALKTLIKHDITPDFLHIIEANPCFEQISNVETKDVNFVCEAYTNEVFFKQKFKRHFLTFSNENSANLWLGNRIFQKQIPNFETKGTVSYNALFSAKILGCNPIVLIGQDLAYQNGQLYSANSPYSVFKCVKNKENNKFEVVIEDREKFASEVLYPKGFDLSGANCYINSKLSKLNSSLMEVESQNGEKIPTDSGYALFIQYFQDFAKNQAASLKLYNASENGANIQGFENKKLCEIFESEASIESVEEVLQNINFSSEIDVSKVQNNIKNEVKMLELIEKHLNHAKMQYINWKREIKRARLQTEKALRNLQTSLKIIDFIYSNIMPSSPLILAICVKKISSLNDFLSERNLENSFGFQKELSDIMDELFSDLSFKIGRLKENLQIYNFEI